MKTSAPIPSIGELQQKRARLAFEIALGKTRDTAELARIRREIARRLTVVNNEQKTESEER
jgi:ribosomal protein L29